MAVTLLVKKLAKSSVVGDAKGEGRGLFFNLLSLSHLWFELSTFSFPFTNSFIFSSVTVPDTSLQAVMIVFLFIQHQIVYTGKFYICHLSGTP